MKSNFTSHYTTKNTFFKNILLLPFWLRVVAFIATITLVLSLFFIFAKIIDNNFFTSVPKHGGSLSEGIVGRPRLINPVLAKTEVDRDMVSLIYSGLFRASGDILEPDLAESIEVNEDGKVYTVKLKDNIYFHDGAKITAEDIIFTIDRIQNKGLPVKSPLAPNWNGVNVTMSDPKTIVFALEKPHATFIEALTFGILPKHIWEPVGITDFDQTDYNLKPIGSGPYKIDEIVRDSENGLAKKYALIPFDKYAHGEPYIKNLDIFFYGSDADRATAYDDGEITQFANVPTNFAKEVEKKGKPVLTSGMPRIFGLYFNKQKKTLLSDASVREALDLAMPREKIIDQVYLNFANSEETPFPGISHATGTDASSRILMADALLEKNGWKKNENGIFEKTDKKSKQSTRLEFSISLPDIQELTSAAQIIKEEYGKFGANVELKTFDLGTFTGNILANRDFDSALFGQVTGRNPDPYSFWHSSQKQHGMNIAQYSDKNVDGYIEKLANTYEETERNDLLQKIDQAIAEDHPAVFIYSPKFIYIVDKSLNGVYLPLMTTASDRFSHIEDWYVSSERIWNFLNENNKE